MTAGELRDPRPGNGKPSADGLSGAAQAMRDIAGRLHFLWLDGPVRPHGVSRPADIPRQ